MRSLALLVLVGCAAPQRPTRPSPVWSQLQRSLPGTWSGTSDGGAKVEVTFKPIANNTALAETFGRPGRETMTLYHADRDDVIATHYCAQGNQPRLRLASAAGGRIILRQRDITDHDAGEPSLVEMELAFGDDWFDRIEIYRDANGALERTRWHFTRVPKEP